MSWVEHKIQPSKKGLKRANGPVVNVFGKSFDDKGESSGLEDSAKHREVGDTFESVYSDRSSAPPYM
jgi:hypothetical protein